MKSKRIIVAGSTNMDMVVKTKNIPVPGQTVLAGDFFMNPGGKGANQAVAVARLGGEVMFVSKMGNDVFGKQFSLLFGDEGIDTSHILYDKELPSGVALITVDEGGENSIVVASGANANLLPGDLEGALEAISHAGILLLQLEIPMETVHFAINYAASKGVKIILNPAPANTLPVELLSKIDVLTPNETEAAIISGVKITDLESAKEAAKIIYDRGVRTVIITMGAMGALICEEGKFSFVTAEKVETVDTTAAGDVFNGALAVAFSEEKDMEAAVKFACEAASFSVTRLGAQASIPRRNELVAQKLKLSTL